MMIMYSITINSIMQASFASTIMMCLLYGFRKRDRHFDMLTPKVFLLVYSLCLLRMTFPIEMDGFTRPVPGGIIWNYANSILVRELTCIGGLNISLLNIILFIWLFIAVIKIKRYIKKYFIIHKVLWNVDEIIDTKKYSIKNDISIIKTKIIKTDIIDSPCCMGVFKRIIVIPNIEYSNRELEIIIKHEYEHLKNNDPFIKNIINIIYRIYWWNPVVYYIQKNIGQGLEICCDIRVLKENRQDDRVEYLETILQEYNRKNTNKQEMMLSLADGDCYELYERFKVISSIKQKKSISKQIAIMLVFGILLVSSYGFVLQAKYNPSEEDVGYYEGNVLTINKYNSYIIEDTDGNYSLYYRESLFSDEIKIFDIEKEELPYYTYSGTKIKEQE